MESHEQNSNPCELDSGSLQRLSDLVGRAHARTSATGVAIAIVQADELITCAASGPAAPEVGSRSPIAGSFSGRCAASGEMLTCEDVGKDDRVNGEACAAMGIFSMVMVPVSENKHVRGVLAAFSDRPNSFSPSQLTVLNTFAEIANELLQHRDQANSGEAPTPVGSVTDPSAKCETVLHDVLSAYEKERRANDAGRTNVTAFPQPKPATEPRTPFVVSSPSPSPVSPAAIAASTTTGATRSDAASAQAERAPEKFAPQAVRPMSTAGGAATKMAVLPEIAARPERLSPQVPPQAKPKNDSDLLSFAVDPMPMKQTGQFIGNAKSERVAAADDAALFSSLSNQHPSSGSPMKFVIGAAFVLVLAGGLFGFSRMSHRTPTVSAATPAVDASSSQPTSTLNSQPTTPSPVPAPAVTEDLSTRELPKVVEDSHRRQDVKPVSEHKPEPTEPEPLFIKSAGARSAKAQPAPDVQAPLVAGLGASRMPEMKASVVPPKADFPTASVTAPKLINGPRPMFPAAANAMHVTSDTVVLNAKVMTNGKIGDISVVRGNPVFVQAVKEAVKHWQYTPAQLNHQPTESTIEIVFKFGQGS